MGRALIVSAGASSNEYISARLTELGYARPIIVPSAAEARRRMLESDFELIVVNSPLPDEFGHELCADAVEKTDAGVIFLAKAAAAEQLLTPLSEEGVLLVTKPFSNTFFCRPSTWPPPATTASCFAAGESADAGKLAQVRLVSRAKCCLIELGHMTEAEAHRYIEKKRWTPGATAPRSRRRYWTPTTPRNNAYCAPTEGKYLLIVIFTERISVN